jgi:hypothetical protein
MMAKRTVKQVLESYRDHDGTMRYALQGEVIEDAEPEPKPSTPPKAAPQKRARK